MALTREQLLTEASFLPSSERQKLIEDLRQLSEDSELSPQQLMQLRQRVAALKDGKAVLLDGAQAMKDLRAGLLRP